MKKTFLFFSLLILTIAFGQDNNFKKFKEFYKNGDTIAVEKLLKDWEKNPNAEFFVSSVNYYFNKSRKEVVSLDQDLPKTEGFELKDDNGKTVAYLSSKNYYDKELLQKTFKYFDEGISKFPNRLDIRFGKIYILGQLEDFENFSNEIVKTIQYSSQNNNQWLWSEDANYDGGEKRFLLSIQDYNNQIYETNDDSLLKYMKVINEEVLKYYPNHVESLSNLAIVSMISKNYDEALSYLLKAEKLAPEDFIVLNNLAYSYKMKNDKTNAIKYYQLVKKFGDDRAKSQAENELKKLQQ